jgi:hypothetical protein
MRTITIQAAALIDAPAARVYEIIADYRNEHPHILPKSFFTRLDVIEGGRGAGTVIDVGGKFLGRTTVIRGEVTEPIPGCLISEAYPEQNMVTTFRVSPEHRGHHAHVTIQTEIPRSPGLKGVAEAWLLPRMLRKVYDEELRLLAERARERQTVDV